MHAFEDAGRLDRPRYKGFSEACPAKLDGVFFDKIINNYCRFDYFKVNDIFIHFI